MEYRHPAGGTEETEVAEAVKVCRKFGLMIDIITTGIYRKTVVDEVEEVPPRERAAEYLMTRLRTTYGIQGEEYENKYLLPFAPLEKALETFSDRNLAIRTSDGHWYLTPEGFLLSNSIITDLQIIQERTMRG